MWELIKQPVFRVERRFVSYSRSNFTLDRDQNFNNYRNFEFQKECLKQISLILILYGKNDFTEIKI